VLLEKQVDRLLTQGLGRGPRVEGQEPELLPCFGPQIDRQDALALAARRPRRCGLLGLGDRLDRLGFACRRRRRKQGGTFWSRPHAAFLAWPLAGMSTTPHSHLVEAHDLLGGLRPAPSALRRPRGRSRSPPALTRRRCARRSPPTSSSSRVAPPTFGLEAIQTPCASPSSPRSPPSSS
jgi:hypothetical protein